MRYTEEALRSAAIDWVRQRAEDQVVVTYEDAAGFVHGSRRVPLIDRQRGIRKPRDMTAALSIRTTFTPPGARPPYEDAEGPDGLLRYKYRGADPHHPENVALREAWRRGLPLIWFVGVARGVFTPVAPVWLVADEPELLQFVVAVDGEQRGVGPGEALDADRRQYLQRLTKVRLHQPVFRAQVLQAYTTTCAMCRLRVRDLVDAAHILPDGHPSGLPVVPNGLALCKIHHAAFDRNILGVRPDRVVEVRRDVLRQTDGPMLRHGLQEMAGVQIFVPSSPRARPDRNRLEERYEMFRQAS